MALIHDRGRQGLGTRVFELYSRGWRGGGAGSKSGEGGGGGGITTAFCGLASAFILISILY